MSKLYLEKEETLEGTIVYRVCHGISILARFEEIGAHAQECVDGKSVALTLAEGKYNEFLERYKDGYPKTETLLSTEIQ
jgi:hypothetical protein